MPNYKTSTETNREALSDFDIACDVNAHMNSIIDQCQLRKIDHRAGINQAAYAIAKRFGHRSNSPDLYLDGPGREASPTMRTQSGCGFKVPTTGRFSLYWDLRLLGKQTKKALTTGGNANVLTGNSADPNVVTIDFCRNDIYVDIELTGPAFINFCIDTRGRLLARRISVMLMEKWGSNGVTLDAYKQHGNPQGGEGYRYIRMNDGVAQIMTQGWGYVTGWLTPDQRG